MNTDGKSINKRAGNQIQQHKIKPMIKTFNKLEIEGNLPNILKAIYENCTVTESLYLNMRNKTRMSAFINSV